MRRRDLLGLIGGVSACWVGRSIAQQPQGLHRIGVILTNQPEADARITAFEAALQSLGWLKGQNLSVDYRLAEAGRDGFRAAAEDIIARHPELVVVQSSPGTQELLAVSHTIPIVFVHVSDPIGSGFVKSFAQPGGNVTGFTDIEASLGSKWLQLLKEAMPGINRAALMFNPDTAPDHGDFFLGPFTEAGASLGVKTIAARVHDAAEIERRWPRSAPSRAAGSRCRRSRSWESTATRS